MVPSSPFGKCRQIARIEWVRQRRERAASRAARGLFVGVVLLLAAGLGRVAYAVGRGIATGGVVPLGQIRVGTLAVFGLLIWRSSERFGNRFTRVDPSLLLTTVPARTTVGGLMIFVTLRLSLSLVVPVAGLAVGFGLGTGAPTSGFTVTVGVAGLVVLAVLAGAPLRLFGRAIGMRLSRSGQLKDLLLLFGWVPLLVAVFLRRDGAVTIDVADGWLASVPVTWFADLALAGTINQAALSRAVGALVLFAVAVPLSIVTATVLARHVWEGESTASTRTYQSGLEVGAGLSERLLGDYVPRPVLTVARKRWVQERRVPRGLMTALYAVIPLLWFLTAVFTAETIPHVTPVAIAFTLAVMAGLAFGQSALGAEYPALPMTLTTVDGEEFVRGTALAALGVGLPPVVVSTVLAGLVAPVGAVETLLIAGTAAVLCACTATVATAVGLRIPYYEFWPIPMFLTDVPVYDEMGLSSFHRLGVTLVAVTAVAVPAAAGFLPPVFEPAAAASGVPTAVVRIGALLLTAAVAGCLARYAYWEAVDRYRRYEIP